MPTRVPSVALRSLIAPVAVLALVLVLALAPPLANADGTGGAAAEQKGAFGIGLMLGEPTGISARLYLANDAALQAGIGAAFVGRGVQASVDYVIHPWVLENHVSFVLPAYIGFGARGIQYRDRENGDGKGIRTFAAGARAVAGLLFDFRDLPLDAFVEVAGVAELEFGDGIRPGLGLNVGAGARYYF